MKARNDAARIMAVYRKHWNAFRAELKGMDIEQPELTWSHVCNMISQFTYNTSAKRRDKINHANKARK